MRIINLVENTEGASGCGCENGLRFYIETENHKLHVDTGASDLLLKNAEKLGIDLTKVDTVVLSHGHYDHGGGILPFAEINPEAKIYIPESAFEEYYSMRDGAPPQENVGNLPPNFSAICEKSLGRISMPTFIRALEIRMPFFRTSVRPVCSAVFQIVL